MPALMRLHVIAHARHEDHNRDIGQTHDIYFILADADGFNHDEVAAGSVQHRSDIGRGARQPAQRAARRHAANINPGIGEMILHADAVAQNRSASVGTGWIYGDNAHGAIVFAIEASKLIDQRALPRSRRPGQAEDARLAAVRKQRLQQLGPSRRAVLHGRNGASQRPHVAGAQLVNPELGCRGSNDQCKAEGDKLKLKNRSRQKFAPPARSAEFCGLADRARDIQPIRRVQP